MTIEELNSRIGLTICEIDDISIATNECKKLSIEFAISVLESDDLLNVRASSYGESVYYKIQDLKQYLYEI